MVKGTFSDFKLIKTRKLAQLVIELPIESADAAIAALGGLPRSDNERWVAVVRLDVNAPVIDSSYDDWGNAVIEEKTRTPFDDLPFTQQACIKSKDITFQLWMSKHIRCPGREFPDCATAIRYYCSVESRRDIIKGTSAGDLWLLLLKEFEARG